MPELKIKIPAAKAGSYKIKIGTGILDSVLDEVDTEFKQYNKFVITDKNLVSAGHLGKLLGRCDIGVFVIDPPGEISKNISTLISIIETMEKAYLGRDTLILALGGGTVGDIAGFAAAVFKRGVSVIQIPTTTVSQGDSAIGGKTGVDSSMSKNAFGVFWHPASVYIDVATLKTLGEREFRAGLVESVKHALIANAEYFEYLEKNIDAIIKREPAVLEKIALFNCEIKAGVVEVDPTEKNQRRMLNYGHTVGHAVEAASRFELLHGEAVATGIIAAGLIEIEMGLGRPDRLQRIKRILEKIGVPLAIKPALGKKSIIDIIKHDKKAINKWPKFVLIDKIGHVYCPHGQWAVEVQMELVERVLDKLYE